MIYFISGPDIFRAQQFVKQLINQTTQSDPDIHVQKIDGGTVQANELAENLEPLALFAQKKLILIKNLFSSKSQKKSQEIFLNYLNNPDPNNQIIIWEQDNIDKRSKFYKKINKITKAKDFPLLKKPQLISWVKDFCQQQQINIQPPAIINLVNKTQNTFSIYNELVKAKTYSNNNITTDTIEKLTIQTPQEIIFDLTDQIGHKKNGLAYQTAINLTQKGEDPLKILASLSTHIQNLIIIKELSDQNINPSQTQQKTKLHPFVIKKCLQQSRNFSLTDLKKMHHDLATTDYKLKTGQSDFKTEIFKIITNNK